MARERCRHPMCSCEASPDHGGYCSPECASADTDAACYCGHDECEDAQAAADR